MIHTYNNRVPDTEKALFVAKSAELAGTILLGKETSVWYNVSMRADIGKIEIGDRTNIQDGTVVHVSEGIPTVIGKGVTVGHNAIVHACTIGDDCLIGMGAIILDGSEIGGESIVGAGALVTQNKKFPPRSLIIGSPAKAIRSLEEKEIEAIRENAAEYITLAQNYAKELEEHTEKDE